jgi:hypothetical protein
VWGRIPRCPGRGAPSASSSPIRPTLSGAIRMLLFYLTLRTYQRYLSVLWIRNQIFFASGSGFSNNFDPNSDPDWFAYTKKKKILDFTLFVHIAQRIFHPNFNSRSSKFGKKAKFFSIYICIWPIALKIEKGIKKKD